MTPLLTRLAQGDLPSDEWCSLAASRKSLHVRINRLREQGYRIISIPGERPIGRGQPSVTYRLLDKPPLCACCGQVLPEARRIAVESRGRCLPRVVTILAKGRPCGRSTARD
jgi:hypothetical protein